MSGSRVAFIPTNEGAEDLRVIAPQGVTQTTALHRAMKLLRVVIEHQKDGGQVILRKGGREKEVILL